MADTYVSEMLDLRRENDELRAQLRVVRQQRRLLYAQVNQPGLRQPMAPEMLEAFRWLETLAQPTPGASPKSPARRQEQRAGLLVTALLVHYDPVLATDSTQEEP